MMRVDAERAPPADEAGVRGVGAFEPRPPHQRAVGEDPKVVRVRHAYSASSLPAARRKRTPEIGSRGVLARLDDAATDARVPPRSRRNSVSPSAQADGALQRRQVLGEPPQHLDARPVLLLRNTSRHIVGSDAAMRVKSRKPPAENLITSLLGHAFEVLGRVDDVVGDQVRHVAGDREHHVVVLGAHDLDLGAERLPERLELLDRRLVGVRAPA